MKKFKVIAKSFKKMGNPCLGGEETIKYVCYVQANSIPNDIDNWLGTNPREQKMTTNVATKIIDSLKENRNFHELNRGIVLSTKKVMYDNQTGELEIQLEDPEIHGNIDGGHTLRAILKSKLEGTLVDDRYVFMELFTGMESPVELAAARNTSVQVDLKSIAELEKSFDILKNAFSGCEFADRIAYKMNEHYNDDSIIPIDVRETLSILMMFSQIVYPIKTAHGTLSESQPTQCYTGKETTLRKFLNLSEKDRNSMVKSMTPIIFDVFSLYDLIEKNFAIEALKAGKRYGTRKYSKFEDNKDVGRSLFSQSSLKYLVPKGILYPLLASFRALIVLNKETMEYEWKKSPFDIWNVLASKLTSIILDERTENPDALGKNSNLWSNLFKEVYILGYMD